MKKYIIYYGISFFPDGNALCQRALSMSRLIRNAGYTPVLIGVTREASTWKTRLEGCDCYCIHYPSSGKEWLQFILSIREIKRICRELGTEHIHAFIASDLKTVQLWKALAFARRSGFELVADIMDWYGKSSERFPHNVVRDVDTFLTMQVCYPRVKRKIVVSSSLFRKYEAGGVACERIPMLCEKAERSGQEKSDSRIRLMFAGDPGKHCEKEKLDWVLKALSPQKRPFVLYIAGVGEEEFFRHNGGLRNYMRPGIEFLGRLSHEECVEKLKTCDFQLLVREKNRVSEYGFSTKLMESFRYGVPLIATDTGDTADYVEDGVNGYLSAADEEAFTKKVDMIFSEGKGRFRELRRNRGGNGKELLEELYYASFGRVIEGACGKDRKR